MTKEDQILEILQEHTKLLNTCIVTLNDHIKKLDEHTKKLAKLSEMVTEHNYILLAYSEQINNLTKRVSCIEEKLDRMEEKMDSMHQSIIHLEVDFSDKSSVLFDGHTIHQEHLERNDKDIESLQVTTHSHSERLISLELDSKEHTKQLESLSSK